MATVMKISVTTMRAKENDKEAQEEEEGTKLTFWVVLTGQEEHHMLLPSTAQKSCKSHWMHFIGEPLLPNLAILGH